MKRLATTSRFFAFALLASAALCANARATVLLADAFTYPNGNLAGNGGWTTFSGTGTDIAVNAGRAIGNHSNAPDDKTGFAAQPTTSKTYACFDVIVPAPAGTPKATYFAMITDGGTTNFYSRVYIVKSGATFTFAISHSSTTTTVGVTAWPVALLYDHKYNVVINEDPVNKSSTLWVDPATESSASVTDANSATTEVSVNSFCLRQSSTASTLPASPDYSGTTNATYSVDNLGVGTTFTDACAQYRSTPATHSTWGTVKSMYR